MNTRLQTSREHRENSDNNTSVTNIKVVQEHHPSYGLYYTYVLKMKKKEELGVHLIQSRSEYRVFFSQLPINV